jgi:RNA polymerase sigma factor (sigma-70 family)
VRADFTTFYADEAPRLVRAVTLIIGDPVLAEDAVTEAFARAWARWPQIRAHPRPAAWIMRVALNESRSRFRRRKVERRKAHAVARPEASTDPEPDGGVWAAVAALPAPERELIARYFADLTQPEIAQALGLPPGTVASGLHRARKQLGLDLQPTYEEEITR